MPLARAAEEEALRVDPALPEAHALLAVCAGNFGHDWSGAEREWRIAMSREPISRDVRFWYGNHYLLPIGRVAGSYVIAAGKPVPQLFGSFGFCGLMNDVSHVLQ